MLYILSLWAFEKRSSGAPSHSKAHAFNVKQSCHVSFDSVLFRYSSLVTSVSLPLNLNWISPQQAIIPVLQVLTLNNTEQLEHHLLLSVPSSIKEAHVPHQSSACILVKCFIYLQFWILLLLMYMFYYDDTCCFLVSSWICYTSDTLKPGTGWL